jgi:hypothetical protein
LLYDSDIWYGLFYCRTLLLCTFPDVTKISFFTVRWTRLFPLASALCNFPTSTPSALIFVGHRKTNSRKSLILWAFCSLVQIGNCLRVLHFLPWFHLKANHSISWKKQRVGCIFTSLSELLYNPFYKTKLYNCFASLNRALP